MEHENGSRQHMLWLAFSLILFVVAFFFVFLGLWGPDGLDERAKLEQDLVRVRTELDAVRSENERLKIEIERFENDAQARRDAVRKQLGLLEPNEVVLVPTE